MLFDYVAPKLQSGRAATVWSQFPLQPLTPGAMTPFSYSVLAELASRAWFVYYDRLGFDPEPRSKVVRRYKGRFYFNLSLCAQLEADHAGLEPLTLQVNGERQPLASWEKPGFLAGFKLGRAQKKIDETWVEAARQMGPITDKARAWYLKTQGVQRWGQAEVLQIMEEIERVGVESMVALLAARINIGQSYARLLADLAGTMGANEALLLVNNALCDLSGLHEMAMTDALPSMAETLTEPATLAWLKAGDFANWRKSLPNQAAVERINSFMVAYGHRTVHEGEIAQPRWSEDASLLMHTLLAQIEDTGAHSVKPAKPAANAQALLAALPSSTRKQGEQTLKKISELHKLQSSALHALAYILAGTRSWALAAAREAMVDKRLHSTDEVFLFELEEIKQMMTGEWNISSLDEIRATTAQRQLEQAAIQQEIAPDLLVGDDEAFVAHSGLSTVAGNTSGPLCQWDGATQSDARGAVVATALLDSGCVLALPLAAGFVAAAGTPCDPFVVAAHAWQKPVAIGLGKRYSELGLTNGAPTPLDVNLNVNGNGVVISTSGLNS